MGLDVVELMMEVEDEFGIKFRDEDCEQLVTVGDLQRQVVQKQGGGDDQPVRANRSGCQSLRTFLWLRATLRETLPVADLRIRPTDSLAQILPQPERQFLWESWRQRAQLPLPNLTQPPVWDSELLTAAGFSAVVALANLMVLMSLLRPAGLIFHTVVVVFLTTSALTGVLLWLWKSGWPHLLPPGIDTLGDMTRSIEPRHWEMLQSSVSSAHAAAVLMRLRQIIHEQLSIPLDQIHPHSRFVDDLGC